MMLFVLLIIDPLDTWQTCLYVNNSWQLGSDMGFRCNRMLIGTFAFVIGELE